MFSIIGDLNARIGRELDIIDTLDENILRERLCIYDVNEYGRSFLDFLNELCVLNGRFGTDSNKSTSILIRSTAVVGYVIVRQSDMCLMCIHYYLICCVIIFSSIP